MLSTSFKHFVYLFYVCPRVCAWVTFVHHVHAGALERPGIRVTGRCELLYGCRRSKLGPL